MPGLTEILDNLFGAVLIGSNILLSPLTRPFYSNWGATAEEINHTWPGDDMAPNPRLVTTWAVTIEAPPEDIWPWLVQIGQGRGGWYSYELLENLAGCQMETADHILPEHQNLQVGDEIIMHPSAPVIPVAAIEPNRALIIGGRIDEQTANIQSFILDEQDDSTTRLLLRTRVEYSPTLGSILTWRVFSEPISFGMGRKMLLTIKTLVETGS